MAKPTTLFKNKRVLGVEQESTENTAETIVAADCFRVTNPEIEVVRNPLDNESNRTTYGMTKPIPGGKSCNINFGFYLKGSGTAGTAPASGVDDTLQACGFAKSDGDAVVDFDLSETSTSTTVQLFEGVAVGSTGKSKIAKGVKGNLTISMEPGGKTEATFEGQGGLSSDADATVLAVSGEDSTDPVALVSASMTLAQVHTESVWTLDGAAEKIDDGAASNVELAMSFTQGASNETLVGYLVNLQKVGTPANETLGVRIRVETDAAGDPSGTPVANTTVTKATSLIDSTNAGWYLFLLSAGSRGTLTAAADLHVVISADYDTDAANCVQIDTQAVAAGAQKCKFYDAAWAALALKNLSLVVLTLPTAIDDLYFGTSEINLNNEVNLTADCPSDAQGFSAADITGADPTITVTPRDALDSDIDFAEYFDDQDELFFSAQVGSTAGNIVEIFGKRAVVVDVVDEEREGKMARSLPLRIDRELTEAGLTIRFR
jgi:hypothetical protein